MFSPAFFFTKSRKSLRCSSDWSFYLAAVTCKCHFCHLDSTIQSRYFGLFPTTCVPLLCGRMFCILCYQGSTLTTFLPRRRCAPKWKKSRSTQRTLGAQWKYEHILLPNNLFHTYLYSVCTVRPLRVKTCVRLWKLKTLRHFVWLWVRVPARRHTPSQGPDGATAGYLCGHV